MMRGLRASIRWAALACLPALAAGCGAGPYGYSREYVPLREERPFHDQGTELLYTAVVADPVQFMGRLISWFGVVERVEPAADGRHVVRLAHRQHIERHLCEGEVQRSCRVTVQFASQGGFSAFLEMRPEDLVPGLDRVQPGTLLKVYGRVRCEIDELDQVECEYDDRGGVVLDALWYRQWPARHYVTTRAADGMRR